MLQYHVQLIHLVFCISHIRRLHLDYCKNGHILNAYTDVQKSLHIVLVNHYIRTKIRNDPSWPCLISKLVTYNKKTFGLLLCVNFLDVCIGYGTICAELEVPRSTASFLLLINIGRWHLNITNFHAICIFHKKLSLHLKIFNSRHSNSKQ